MTARMNDRLGLWVRLADKLPADEIQWRQDGRPIQRDGKFFARFVAFIDAQFVRRRLDEVFPGEWDLTLEALPMLPSADKDGVAEEEPIAFKARLQILGVIREDVGSGRDYKTASTDAFKRAAVRFGIGAELYAYEQNWVQIDGDGKYAKPVEDPGQAYARRQGKTSEAVSGGSNGGSVAKSAGGTEQQIAPAARQQPATESAGPRATDEVMCPKCGGRTWDNRATKRNPRAPDFKCRDRACDGVIWPERKQGQSAPEDEDQSADSREEAPF
jgi:Rad52/22 family double-strand break repair protein